MKVTKEYLKRIIKEELQEANVINMTSRKKGTLDNSNVASEKDAAVSSMGSSKALRDPTERKLAKIARMASSFLQASKNLASELEEANKSLGNPNLPDLNSFVGPSQHLVKILKSMQFIQSVENIANAVDFDY
jgi:hypothetical protein